jgi:hypothetical protein
MKSDKNDKSFPQNMGVRQQYAQNRMRLQLYAQKRIELDLKVNDLDLFAYNLRKPEFILPIAKDFCALKMVD